MPSSFAKAPAVEALQAHENAIRVVLEESAFPYVHTELDPPVHQSTAYIPPCRVSLDPHFHVAAKLTCELVVRASGALTTLQAR